MELFSKDELKFMVDYFTNDLIDMEYTSVSQENKEIMKKLLSLRNKIEDYLQEKEN